MATNYWRSAFGALVFLAALASASAATYTVGDAQGWVAGMNYASWAAQYKFNVGDVLVFSYSPMHGVVEVSAADYQSCNSGNPINVYTTGQDSVTLTKPSQYFICGTPGHCTGGMALQVSAAAAAATTPLASPPSPPITPSPSATTTPSPSATITPAPSAAITPPPAAAIPPSTLDSPSLPLLGPPAPPAPPAPPTPPAANMDISSSTMVLASSVITLAAVAMVLG